MRYLCKRQAGLTLVELMVAAVLSLVLLSGVLLVFSANKTTYRMQTGLGTLQENGRYALRQIVSDLQTAGYGGCLSTHIIPRPLVYNHVSSSPAHLDDFRDGVFFDGRNDVSSTVTYGGKDAVHGTDVIEIRGPLRAPVAYVADEVGAAGDIEIIGSGSGFAVNEFLIIGDCQGADIFRATAVTVNTSTNTTDIGHGSGANNSSELRVGGFASHATVTAIDTHTYFIGDTNRLNQNGEPILALYRFDGTSAQELVDGVENLQVQFALDTNNDAEIDGFAHPGTVSDWSEVMAVKVSLLVNSVQPSSAVDAPYTFAPVSSAAIEPGTPGSDDDFLLRQEFTSLVSVRNNVLPEEL